MFIRKKIIRDFVQPTWKVIFYESPKTQNPLDKWATGCSKTQNPFSKSKPTQNPKPTFTTQNPLSKPKTHFQNPKPTFKIQSTFCVVKMCLRFSHRNPKPTFTTPNPLSKPKTHFQHPKPTFKTQNPLSKSKKPKTHWATVPFQNPKPTFFGATGCTAITFQVGCPEGPLAWDEISVWNKKYVNRIRSNKIAPN